MFSLEEAQANFIATINQGPDALNHALFAGPIDRVLLGLKAHANTISHARLVALEDSFPLTRAALGDEQFNQLSRAYVETAEAAARDNNSIGECFPQFLKISGIGAAEVDLSAIEWAWLQSYHAADALALKLSDIAGLSEQQLVNLPVQAHPAAQLIALTGPLSDQLAEVGAIMPNPAAILAIRPEVKVQLVPLDATSAAVFAATKKSTSIGNLLALASEQPGISNPAEPMVTLLGAGALMEGIAHDCQ
jgi:hypothetical protein